MQTAELHRGEWYRRFKSDFSKSKLIWFEIVKSGCEERGGDERRADERCKDQRRGEGMGEKMRKEEIGGKERIREQRRGEESSVEEKEKYIMWCTIFNENYIIDDRDSMRQRKIFGSGSGSWKEMKSVDNKKSVDMD